MSPKAPGSARTGRRAGSARELPTQAKNGLGWATEPFLNPHLSTGAPPFNGVRKVDFHNPPLVGISVSTDAVPLSPKAQDACPELAEGHPGGGDTNPAKKSPRVILQTGPCWHINFCVLFCADGWPIQARFWA